MKLITLMHTMDEERKGKKTQSDSLQAMQFSVWVFNEYPLGSQIRFHKGREGG